MNKSFKGVFIPHSLNMESGQFRNSSRVMSATIKV